MKINRIYLSCIRYIANVILNSVNLIYLYIDNDEISKIVKNMDLYGSHR